MPSKVLTCMVKCAMIYLMAIFKRTQKPRDCSLSNVVIGSRAEVKTGEPVHRPKHNSQAYHDTIQARGEFNDWYYRRVADGEYIIETPTEEVIVITGVFSCRRLENNPDLTAPLARSGYYEADVAKQVYRVVQKLGLCATCPYSGMSEIEADRYDADANVAEAARLQSERTLAVARQELDAYITENGGQVH